MSTWVPDGTGIVRDEYAYGGDATVTACFSVRYLLPDKNARITEYHYGESGDQMDHTPPYFVTCMTEYFVHDGTENENEVWCDYEYDRGNDLSPLDYETVEEAEAAAKESAERSDPEAYLWDGEPMWAGVNNRQ